MLHAVLTGDVVHSTRLSPAGEERLVRVLEEMLSPHLFEFYRGDSFQVYLENAQGALKLALRCRTAAIAMGADENEVSPDLRLSLGIGAVEEPVTTLGLAKGEAFLLSGRTLDGQEKTGQRLLLVAADPLPALTLALMADHLNSIYSGMTAKQAEVILELLNGNTQQQVAGMLGRSKSTINQHVTAGKWEEIESILGHYKKLIELMSV